MSFKRTAYAFNRALYDLVKPIIAESISVLFHASIESLVIAVKENDLHI